MARTNRTDRADPLSLTEWLRLPEVEAAIPAMRHFGVSAVARGDEASAQTGIGFVTAYRKAQGSPDRMDGLAATRGQTWGTRRDNFVKRHMAQARKRGEDLMPGGIPSRRMLGLIAWAYVPPAWGRQYDAWVRAGRPLTARGNPRRNRGTAWDDPNRAGSTVTSIMFDRSRWTALEAKRWLREHDFKAPAVDRQANTLRFRQHPPTEFHKDSFRTIPFGRDTGIQAIVAVPK